MDPYSSPYIIPNNSPNNPFPPVPTKNQTVNYCFGGVLIIRKVYNGPQNPIPIIKAPMLSSTAQFFRGNPHIHAQNITPPADTPKLKAATP